ncbi:cysteine hydrolase [Pseudonocardia petroleophila]|uniref:Cysteine hydrolase n=1 Tax=Pseudonocardia petroleophila TaxID=37331 RepID=A0A7G7MFG3_9PSEU|nr:isochorismatase family cysteine hydrolase [Pseudonocardia petroleophila]QNG51524.1 cysteine hydrolase [Pseudonocardia petroleophila]
MSFDPARTAVVAVHFQNDIVGPAGAFAGFFRAEVERTGVLDTATRLLDGARAAGATVVHTRVAFQPGHGDLNPNSPLLGMVAQAKCLEDGTPGADITAEVAPRDGDHVVTHTRVGGFQGSDLDATLRRAGIDTVVFIGVATNASVEGTARAASDLGYRTVVVSDACSAGSPEAHEASLGSLGLLAEIVTTDDLLAGLAAPAEANA